jgi:ubiquitin carboxyl-terminal hydrolase 7
LWIFEIWNFKIYKLFKPEDLLSEITEPTAFFAEEIDFNQEDAVSHDFDLIQVTHFYLENSMQNFFGNPFLMRIHKKEQLSSLKARLAFVMKVTMEEAEKWKFAYVSFSKLEYLKDAGKNVLKMD